MKSKNIDILKYDIFTKEEHSSTEDIRAFLNELDNRINKDSSGAKKKMSYSISPKSQILIKKVSEESGATQGSIVESSPILFAKIVLDSLERRKKGIDTLKLVSKQVKSSLKLFEKTAPHLKPYTDQVDKILNQALKAEEKAVYEKNYQGIDTKNLDSIDNIKNDSKPPYNREIEEFLKDNELLISLFKGL